MASASSSNEWYLNESFWTSAEPFVFSEQSYLAAKSQIDQLIEITGLSHVSGAAPPKVLDLACGPGRHAIAFAQLGFNVTGVDACPHLLNKASLRVESSQHQIEWVHEDIRRFTRTNTFDLAISMMTSFGYFDAPEDNLKVASNAFVSLKQGGSFVIDVVGKEVVARVLQSARVHELPTGELMIERPRVVNDWSRIENEWIFIKEGHAQRFPLRLWLYSGDELKSILLNAGFSSVRLLGDFDGLEYGPQAVRLIAVARK